MLPLVLPPGLNRRAASVQSALRAPCARESICTSLSKDVRPCSSRDLTRSLHRACRASVTAFQLRAHQVSERPPGGRAPTAALSQERQLQRILAGAVSRLGSSTSLPAAQALAPCLSATRRCSRHGAGRLARRSSRMPCVGLPSTRRVRHDARGDTSPLTRTICGHRPRRPARRRPSRRARPPSPCFGAPGSRRLPPILVVCPRVSPASTDWDCPRSTDDTVSSLVHADFRYIVAGPCWPTSRGSSTSSTFRGCAVGPTMALVERAHGRRCVRAPAPATVPVADR